MLDMALREAALGEKIAKARHARGWKQKDLAAALHVEPVTVSRWETGRATPDLDKLERVAAALKLPLSELVASADGDGVTPVVERLEALAVVLDDAAERMIRAAEILEKASTPSAQPRK